MRAGPSTPLDQGILSTLGTAPEPSNLIAPTTPTFGVPEKSLDQTAPYEGEDSESESDTWSVERVVKRAAEVCNACDGQIKTCFTASMILMRPECIVNWESAQVEKALSTVMLFGDSNKSTSTLVASYNAGSLMTRLKTLRNISQRQISVMLRSSTTQVSRCMKLFNVIQATDSILFLYSCEAPWGWVRDNLNELEREIRKYGQVFQFHESS
jgi:hypothetical protein